MIAETDITQVSMLLGAVATLGGVIAALWRQMIAHFGRVDEKLETTHRQLAESQEERILIWQTIARQQGLEVEVLQKKSELGKRH